MIIVSTMFGDSTYRILRMFGTYQVGFGAYLKARKILKQQRALRHLHYQRHI